MSISRYELGLLGGMYLDIRCSRSTVIRAGRWYSCLDTHRATPTIRLDESRRASGSFGSAIRSHNCEISAVKTDRLGSFLKDDLEPSVAANLLETI